MTGDGHVRVRFFFEVKGGINMIPTRILFHVLFECMCIYFNQHELEWNGIEFSLILLQSTSTHMD
jgi:hypothetical protein